MNNKFRFPSKTKNEDASPKFYLNVVSLILKISPGNWQHKVAKPQSFYSMEAKHSLL